MNSRTERKKSVTRPVTRRMSAQDRMNQIVAVAVDVINRKGYHGMSLQDIASEIGISQTAVIHRVKNKQGLLFAVIEHYYDQADAGTAYLSQFNEGGERYGQYPLIPEYMEAIVTQNSQQPEMTRLFEVLNTEAMSPDHPAHDYFAQRPQRMREEYRRHEWMVPQGVDGEFVYMFALAAMYGLEGRWLADPDNIDFIAAWKRYADYIFPLPMWANCR